MNFNQAGLSQEQIRVLAQASPWLAGQGYYLAGGTALAIYFGHRRSIDLDWFTNNLIPDPLVLAQRFRDAGLAFKTGRTAPGTLYGWLGNVLASFIEYRYPLLQPLVIWPETGAALASLDDLACMKLSAIAQRSSKKDFYDVHALLSRHRPLSELSHLYQQKYSLSDTSPVLYGLVYFDEVENEPQPLLIETLSWQRVKKDILRWLKEATHAKGEPHDG